MARISYRPGESARRAGGFAFSHNGQNRAPNKVFIGGSDGELKRFIMAQVLGSPCPMEAV